MNALFKELRPLSLPFWVTLILAAVLPLVRMLNNPILLGDAATLWGFVVVLTQMLFFCGILLLAVLPFGSEFQYQTFPLLLSQPRSRWRIWKERTLLAGALIGICGLVHWLSHMAVELEMTKDLLGRIFLQGPMNVPLSDVSGMDLLAIFGFMLASACTAGFWTLGGRSVIAGVVFTFAGALLGTGLLYAVVSRFTENENVFFGALMFAGPIWCGLFMWLGWRSFATMELKGASLGESGEIPLLSKLSWKPQWVQSSASGRLKNLVRKELRLQKPVFIITVLFVVCWVVAALLSRAQQVQATVYQIFLAVMTIGFVPIVAMLSASLAIVDEKTLGIASWHLTFPVGALSQWFLKLMIALGIMAIGVAVPCLMFWFLPPSVVSIPDLNYVPHFWTALGVTAIISIVTFWAATLTDTVVRAVIITVAAIAILSASAALGIWLAETYGSFQVGFIRLGLSWPLFPATDLRDPMLEASAVIVVLGIMVLLLLQRSFLQFRRLQVSRGSVVKWALLMIFVSCGGWFWCADLIESLRQATAGY